jgi:hypothetical protein
MDRDRLLHRALAVAAVFNLGGAVLFAFPASGLGAVAGLPPDVPVAYRAMTALFILLFGGAYAWLAAQETIDRPFVAFGAIGKASAFLVVLLLWLAGEAAAQSVALISGDLLFAALFAWCLVVAPASVQAAAARARSRD